MIKKEDNLYKIKSTEKLIEFHSELEKYHQIYFNSGKTDNIMDYSSFKYGFFNYQFDIITKLNEEFNTFRYVIFCLFFLTFNSCKVKTFINNYAAYSNHGTNTIEYEIRKNIKNKKKGIYIYPKMGTKISLKKGKFNGVFEIIQGKDTLFYCNYINNSPIGRYVKNFNYIGFQRHFRTLPLKPKLDFEGNGNGFLNTNHQKEGLWKENEDNGYYKNGLKNGYWEERYTNDISNEISYVKKGYYKNGLKDSIWITEEYSK